MDVLHQFWNGLDKAIGLHLEAKELELSHMLWRGTIVFCFSVFLARIADRRFLGRNACFDVMLGVILGSVLSRGINGQAKFFPTLAASALLVLLHRLVGAAAFHWHWFSVLAKGRESMLVQDGKVNEVAMRQNHITNDDLSENLRLNGGIADVSKVAEARLERNGTVSVVQRKETGR